MTLKCSKLYNKKELERESFFYVPMTSAQDIICKSTKTMEIDNCIDHFIHNEYPNNRYKFISKISDGSASKLYKALDTTNNTNVIIKKIKKNEEWKNELNILKILKNSSPKILNINDFYESNRSAYIVCELYKGHDLFEHIDINVPYPKSIAKNLIKEMILCLKECHDRNIIHLDIKCENYIVSRVSDTNKYELVLIDFGHSIDVKDKDPSKIHYGSTYGTIFYICPEGFENYYSYKSDIWSIGICAHLILTGDFPFYSSDDKNYEKNVRNGNIIISKKLDPETRDFLNKCLEYDPMNRYNIYQLLDHSFLH